MALREVAARKILPKTGIDEVDSEAIVVQACLSRMHDGSVSDAKTRHRIEPKYVAAAVPGDVIDVAHRMQMGVQRPHPTANDERELLVERTDAVVAQSALLRLLKLIASYEEQRAACFVHNSKLSEEVEQLRSRVVDLEDTCRRQAAELAELTHSGHCFQRYREAWRSEHAARQAALFEGFTERAQRIRGVLDKRAADWAARQLVRERRAAFEKAGTSSAAGKNTRDDEDDIGVMMRAFSPIPVSVAAPVLVPGSGVTPDFALKTMVSSHGRTSTTTPAAVSEPATLSSPVPHSEAAGNGLLEHGGVDDGDSPSSASSATPVVAEDNLDQLNDDFELVRPPAVAAAPLLGGGRPTQQAKRHSAAASNVEFVITRFLGTGSRIVKRLDPDSTFVGILANALRYAPGTFLALVLDTASLTGRRVSLARQAYAIGLGRLWDAAISCRHPVVFLSQCEVPPSAPGVIQQSSGIIRAVSRTDTGEEAINELIHGGIIRCYTSSKAPQCKMEALLTPFIDPNMPYFATLDEPGQYVELAFDKILMVPSGYSFACTHPIAGGAYPRSWVCEASLDGLSWETLRVHHNDTVLSRRHPVGVWTVAVATGKYFSRFRLRQTDKNAIGTDVFNVSSIEIYGRVMYVREQTTVPAARLPRGPSLLSGAPRRMLQLPLPDQMPPIGKAKKKPVPKKK